MLLICNPSTPIVCVNEFAILVHDLFGILVWWPPTWDCFHILIFLILLVFSSFNLLNFSFLQPESFGLDWVSELVLAVENKFPVDMIRTHRLLATATSCACGYKFKTALWTIYLKNVSLNPSDPISRDAQRRLWHQFDACGGPLVTRIINNQQPWSNRPLN